jgi:alpha-beta hydrolase superfamily lysophospholipase
MGFFRSCKKLAGALAVAGLMLTSTSASALIMPGESTMPPSYKEEVKPELAAMYSYTQDGEFSDACGLPTYQWMPTGHKPSAIVLGIHGLTLHGRRYRVLARTFAIHGFGFVAPDMRGFGRCVFDDWQKFSSKGDDKRKINNEKSYLDIVKLAQAIKQKYNVPIIMLGESLGCTFGVRAAGEHPDLIDGGLILSAPSVSVNAKMYATPADIKAGVKAIVSPHMNINLNHFITKLVSPRPAVVNEMLEDPYILKKCSLLDMLATDEFVAKTAKWGKTTALHLPVFILQGSADACVVPKEVTDLMMAMPSDDQTLFWRGNYGHLQLETIFVRASVIDALGDWIEDHSDAERVKLSALEQNIDDLGGELVR